MTLWCPNASFSGTIWIISSHLVFYLPCPPQLQLIRLYSWTLWIACSDSLQQENWLTLTGNNMMLSPKGPSH